eukprot:s1270_g18.t1
MFRQINVVCSDDVFLDRAANLLAALIPEILWSSCCFDCWGLKSNWTSLRHHVAGCQLSRRPRGRSGLLGRSESDVDHGTCGEEPVSTKGVSQSPIFACQLAWFCQPASGVAIPNGMANATVTTGATATNGPVLESCPGNCLPTCLPGLRSGGVG